MDKGIPWWLYLSVEDIMCYSGKWVLQARGVPFYKGITNNILLVIQLHEILHK